MKEFLERLLKEYTRKKEINRQSWEQSSMTYTEYLRENSYYDGCIEAINKIMDFTENEENNRN